MRANSPRHVFMSTRPRQPAAGRPRAVLPGRAGPGRAGPSRAGAAEQGPGVPGPIRPIRRSVTDGSNQGRRLVKPGAETGQTRGGDWSEVSGVGWRLGGGPVGAETGQTRAERLGGGERRQAAAQQRLTGLLRPETERRQAEAETEGISRDGGAAGGGGEGKGGNVFINQGV